jgi:hypothetical protein
MDRNSYRDDDDEQGGDQPDAYWRRRVITLALGLGLLGMLAWGFSGGGGKDQSGSSSLLPAAALGTAVPGLPYSGKTATPATGTTTGTTTGASPTGASAAASASGAAPSPSPGTSASGSASRRPAASQSPASGASSSASATVPHGGECAPGNVVLSLFTDQPAYGAGQFPRFVVYAVATSAGSCTFDPGQLQLVVMSSGRIIWDSADCTRDSGARAIQLTRGVPTDDAVTWNREITLPGCQVLASNAHQGTYQVQARTATVQSPVRTFKIAG